MIPKAVKLPSGKWRIQVFIKPYRYSVTGNTRKEVEFKAAEMKLQNKRVSIPENSTLSDAIDKYIESKNAILSPATIYCYKKMKKNCYTNIINLSLKRITQEVIQREMNFLSKNHSPKYVRCAHGFLYAVLNRFSPNLILKTTLPQSIKFEPNIPNESDIQSIIKITQNTDIELPVLMGLLLGMRMSEITGARWNNLKKDLLYVKTALVQAENGYEEKGTKSYAGYRILKLPLKILSLIQAQPKLNDYIIQSHRNHIYKTFVKLCKINGLERFRFHDLRHANASIMLKLNVPDKYAMSRLGHATNTTLKNIYQHTMTEEEQTINNRLETYFNNLL
jgi:integrase